MMEIVERMEGACIFRLQQYYAMLVCLARRARNWNGSTVSKVRRLGYSTYSRVLSVIVLGSSEMPWEGTVLYSTGTVSSSTPIFLSEL